MQDLYKVVVNPYDDGKISTTRLTTFAEEHVGLVLANPVAATVSLELTAVDNALAGLDTKLGSETVKLGLRKARVLAKKQFREVLSDSIARIYGSALTAYGPNGAGLQIIFPEGRQVFSDCEDAQLNDKLDALKTSTAAAAVDLDAAMVTLAATLYTNWATIYGAIGTAKGEKTNAASQRRQADRALRRALGKLRLRIGLALFDEANAVELCKELMPQHLLGFPLEDSGDDGGGTPPPEEEDTTPGVPTLSSTIESGLITLLMSAVNATLFNVYEMAPGTSEWVLVATGVPTGWTKSVSAGSGEWNFQVAGLAADGTTEGPRSASTTQGA